MKKSKFILGMLLAVALISSCSKNGSAITEADKAPASGKQMLEGKEYWEEKLKQETAATLVLTKKLTEEGHQVVEQKMRETTLTSLNLPSDLNVNAFTIKSKSSIKTKDAVYIAPKLYLYRKSDQAHVQARQIGDNVLIPLHAILVDGFSRQIPSADGIKKIDLPETYLVNPDQIRAALVKRNYSESTTFGPLDGCAKKFVLTVAGESYDITPKGIAGSNQCELNRPFTLNLIVPKEKADFIINEALYFNEVDVQASFEVMVGYVEAETYIQLDRNKVYEKLQASLSGKYPPYAKGTVEANLKSIIQSETLSVFIKGDRVDIVNQLFQAAYDSFVLPWELKASNGETPECPKEISGCVSISFEKNSESRNLEVSYQQYSTTLTGQVISSFAKAQQILHPEVVLQSQTDKGTDDYVSNLTSQSRNLMITANRGSILEVHIESAIVQKDNFKVEVNVAHSNFCHSHKKFPDKGCNGNTHYADVTRVYGGIQFSQAFSPSGNMQSPISQELFLKFRDSTGVETKCSFEQLNAIGDGSKFQIKLDNTDVCKAFSDTSKDKQYTITFINELKHPEPLIRLNDGAPFTYSQRFTGIDHVPAHDVKEHGGDKPIVINKVPREFKLKLKMLLRKYDTSIQ